MLKTFYYSLLINTHYTFNSFLYILRKLPIFKDLITEDAYHSNFIKSIGTIFGTIIKVCKLLLFRCFYFYIIFLLSNILSDNEFSFYHIFLIFSIIGIFVHNTLLNPSLKKYLSIIIFKMDAKNYLKYNLFIVTITNFLLNIFCFYIFKLDMIVGMLLTFCQVFFRIIGEGMDIWYYRKYKKFWYTNTILYYGIIIPLFSCCLLPFFGIIINSTIITISLLIGTVLAIFSYRYINHIEDYKLIYKKINKLETILSNNNETRNSIIDVKNKDISIHDNRISKKAGYDYFNSIFFERHKSILLRSATFLSATLLVIYVFLICLCLNNENISVKVSDFLSNRLGWFVLIMYFLNRGSIVTQAMFYNCDHAMLKYNFYRESKVIVGLFKKRLLTVVKVNLLPALIIGIGNFILCSITMHNNFINSISMLLFILILSIFFSLHYLVIYYLFQPYDKDMKVKKISYSIISIATYYISFQFSKLVLTSLILSVFGLIFCLLYIVISLYLVKKIAPKTFKIN